MIAITTVASVVAYTYLDRPMSSGFMLPLLRMAGRAGWLVQHADEATDQLISFRSLYSEPMEPKSLCSPVAVRVGGAQVYVFVEGATVHVGTKTALEPALRNFVCSNPSSLGTILQVYEMIGSAADKRLARSRMKNVINSRFGEGAAHSFYASALDDAFWTKILLAWDLGSNPGRRETLRSQFRVSLSGDGAVHVENVNPDNVHEREMLNFVIEELESEFEASELSPAPIHLPSLVHDGDVLVKIQAATRQEERVALLLSEILRDRENGSSLLRSYQPSAMFERSAIALTRKAFGGGSGGGGLYVDELIMADLVSILFSKIYPMNRGHILRYFSKHLGMYPHVNRAIELKLNKTNSMYVQEHRHEIMENLMRYR